jgi:hypothetical protein
MDPWRFFYAEATRVNLREHPLEPFMARLTISRRFGE